MNRARQQKQADLGQTIADNYAFSKPESLSQDQRTRCDMVDERLRAKGELCDATGSRVVQTRPTYRDPGPCTATSGRLTKLAVPGVKLFEMIADNLAAAIVMTKRCPI